MRCDECRERVVRQGAVDADERRHAEECEPCRAWIAQEVPLMATLAGAGKAWRTAPMPLPAAAPKRIRAVRWVAAAAVLAITAGGLSVLFRPAPASAMSVMRTRLEHGGVRFRADLPGGPSPSILIIAQGARVRVETSDGFIYLEDSVRGERAVLRPDRREVFRGDPPTGTIDFYGLLASLGRAERVESLGVRPLDGRIAEVYRARLPREMDGVSGEGATVWLDVETRLPLRVEIPAAGGATALLSAFAFDEELDPGLFDLSPPGYSQRPPEATTPAVGQDMGIRLRNIGMAFQIYLSEHEGAVPDRLEDLQPYLKEGGLRNPRRPEEPVGFVYVKPTLPLNGGAVLAYERFAEQSASVWVLGVDGHVEVQGWDALRARLP